MHQTFTFGPDHNHPQIPIQKLGGCYIVSPDLPTKEDCRTWMTERFGTHWSMQYDNPLQAGAVRRVMTEIFWQEAPENTQQLWTLFGNSAHQGLWGTTLNRVGSIVPAAEMHNGIKDIEITAYGDDIMSLHVTITGTQTLKIEQYWRKVWKLAPTIYNLDYEDDE